MRLIIDEYTIPTFRNEHPNRATEIIIQFNLIQFNSFTISQTKRANHILSPLLRASVFTENYSSALYS